MRKSCQNRLQTNYIFSLQMKLLYMIYLISEKNKELTRYLIAKVIRTPNLTNSNMKEVLLKALPNPSTYQNQFILAWSITSLLFLLKSKHMSCSCHLHLLLSPLFLFLLLFSFLIFVVGSENEHLILLYRNQWTTKILLRLTNVAISYILYQLKYTENRRKIRMNALMWKGISHLENIIIFCSKNSAVRFELSRILKDRAHFLIGPKNKNNKQNRDDCFNLESHLTVGRIFWIERGKDVLQFHLLENKIYKF